jgi:hypothetical protein
MSADQDEVPGGEHFWSEFEQPSIASLLASFANRDTVLKDAEGRTIQPLISAGKTVAPPEYASVMKTPITWDHAADQLLIDIVNSHGWR